MIPNEAFEEWIEKYHKKEITTDQFQEFLDENPAAIVYFEAYKKDTFNIELLAKAHVRKQTSDYLDKKFKRKVTTIVVGSILAIILTIVLWNTKQVFKDKDALYASYYNSAELSSVRMGNDSETLLDQAVKLYNQGSFKESSIVFEELVQDSSFNRKDLSFLYGGISKMELQQFTEAVESLKQVSKESYFIDEASWYIGLCYIRIGDIDQAEKYFENISEDPAHYKAKEAQSILKWLDKSYR